MSDDTQASKPNAGADIEHLKTHVIAPERRPSLPTVHESPGVPDALEAYGGSGIDAEGPVDIPALRERIIEALKGIYDPEIPVNIFDLGLIYNVEIDSEAAVEVEMTLTAPACPVAGALVEEVAQKTGDVPGCKSSHVQLVWDPPWTKDRMTEAAMLELGLF